MPKPSPVTVFAHVDIAAPVDQVFAAITDWPAQGQWMLGTRVWVPDGTAGHGIGANIHAFTGIWRVGFLDTMTITAWEPPHRVDVAHTGRVVRGTGTMIARPMGEQATRFEWSEDLDLPLGALGVAAWPLVRPLFMAGVRQSLARFARVVEGGGLVERGSLPTVDNRK